MQRAEGLARVRFHWKDGASRLERLYQEGCAKIRLPTPLHGEAPEAVVINTAGGLTGGDRFACEVDIAAGADATVTTQACERVYRSTGNDAHVRNRLTVRAGSRLAWLPQETILFDGARLSRALDVDLEGDAQFLAVEAILFGRVAMGEALRSGSLHDRWRVRRNGRLIFADDFRMEGDVAAKLDKPALLGGRRGLATVVFAGEEPERFVEPARAIVGDDGGASCWGGKLVARIATETGLALRRRLEPLLALLLAGQSLPKVWKF